MAMNKLLKYCADAFEMRKAYPVGVMKFKNKNVRLLAAVCWWLQVKHVNSPFVLGNREAAEVLGVSHVSVSMYFKTLLKSGWIELVASGHRRWGVPKRSKNPDEIRIRERCRMASEYRCPSAICISDADWNSNLVQSEN